MDAIRHWTLLSHTQVLVNQQPVGSSSSLTPANLKGSQTVREGERHSGDLKRFSLLVALFAKLRRASTPSKEPCAETAVEGVNPLQRPEFWLARPRQKKRRDRQQRISMRGGRPGKSARERSGETRASLAKLRNY
jgi:hypothetical protein